MNVGASTNRPALVLADDNRSFVVACRHLLEAEFDIVAAVHSGARHSGTAAVNWTRRKYVRKPRKSPAGRVIAERVKTIFVEPDEALVRRLRLEP